MLGPHQVLGLCPGLEVFTFARTTEPVVTDTGATNLPDHGFDDLPEFDVLLVGGGPDSNPEMTDQTVLDTLAPVGAHARYVTSVCSGSLILAGEEIASLIQLLCEYNPAPPYNTGHPDTAPGELVTMARGLVGQMAPDLFARVKQTA